MGPTSITRVAPLLAVFVLSAAGPADAARVPGPPEQVTDLRANPVEGSSSPAGLTALDGWVYFRAQDPVHGAELWRTDGSPNGAERVADLCPGACSSNPWGFTALGERLLFIAGPQSRLELWATDGTDAGTVRLARLNRWGSLPPFVDGRVALFEGEQPETGDEPWVTDGTPEGTRLLADLCPGPCDAGPRFGARIEAGVVFSASPKGHPSLYRTDGTTEGTVQLKELCSEDCLAPLGDLTVAGGLAFFSAYDHDHGNELWVSDGTAAGTRLVVDLAPGERWSNPSSETAFGSELFFSADGRWWRTDGTGGGTVPAVELEPYGPPPSPIASFPTRVAGRLYFAVRTADGDELWTIERPGAPARLLRGGFERIVLIPPPAGAQPDDRFVFRAVTEDSRLDPWITDGSPEGTRRLAEVDAPVGLLAGLDGTVLFAARDPVHGEELWETDGTPGGTALLENVVGAAASSNPRQLVALDGALFFVAEDGAGTWLWRHRPGEGPAEPVASVEPEATLTARAGRLFVRHAGGHGLAVYDPAVPGGLTELVDFFVQEELVTVGDEVLFARPGPELWATDGTPGGTERVRAWSEYCESGVGLPTIPRIEPVAAGGAAYFLLETDECTHDLWVSDGTTASTVRLPLPGPGLELESISPLGDRRLLVKGSLSAADAFWTLDANLHRTTAFFTRSTGGVRFLPTAGGLAFFAAPENEGDRLWRSDGTSDGTFPLGRVGQILATGGTGSDPIEAAASGGRLFFSSRTDEAGAELRVSDGTVAGTRAVRDLRPGPRSSLPRGLTPVAGGVAFAADDGTAGHEPWWSDGTPEGTIRLADVAAGRDASSPSALAAVGDVVYFSADDGRSGRELWEVTFADNPEPPADATPIATPELPGFELWVRISAGAEAIPARREPVCIPETVCVSGAVPGRSELFVRIVGPKPNGRLWPTLVRFSTSEIEVWIEQLSSGAIRHYRLDPAQPGNSSLDGLFDRDGFVP